MSSVSFPVPVPVPIMPWWKSSSSRNHSRSTSNLLSSSLASSSTSPPPTNSARLFRWSRRTPQHQPRLCRQPRFRRLSNLDLEALALEDPAGDAVSSTTTISCTSSNLDFFPSRCESSPMLVPRPLPRPEDTVASACRESVSSQGVSFSPPIYHGLPLPSPSKASIRAEGNDGNGTAAELTPPESAVGSRIAYQTNSSTQQVDITSNRTAISHRRKALLNSNSSEITDFRLNIPPQSAPVSEFSSPTVSPIHNPGRLSYVNFSVSPGLQSWSAPVIHEPGRTTSFSQPDMKMNSPEPSPLTSPSTKSPILRSRNSSASASPLHSKMFKESSNTWHDIGGNLTVHPLPLPPGALLPSQSTFGHQVGPHSSAKAEGSLNTNQWQKGKLIGSGTFGVVYEATNRNTGALCAMKEVFIIPDDTKSAECLKQLEQEMKFLSQLKHPNIVQYYGSETIEDRLYIYLEYVHPGSINRYIRQYCGSLTESVVRNFTRHILNGLIYLHSKKVMHRDIKGANLLVDVNGVVKLADFGMAKHLSGAAPSHSVRGSPFWMAPEMLQATMNKDIGYDLSVDIWSLGCTIIEMFTGKHPWSDLEGPQAMFKVLHSDPPIPETLSNDGKDFLQCCFRRNPVERPTASMLLDHPFVRSTNHFITHGSLQSFSGLKIQDNSMSPSLNDKSNKSKVEPYAKRKPISNGSENHQPHLEISESSTHMSSRSVYEPFPTSSSSPTRSFSLASAQNAPPQLGVVKSESHRLPNPIPRKT